MRINNINMFIRIFIYLTVFIFILQGNFYCINYYSLDGLVKQRIIFYVGKNIDSALIKKLYKPQNSSLYFSVFSGNNCLDIYENKKITFFVEDKKYTVMTNFSEDVKDVLLKAGLKINEEIYFSTNGKIIKLRNILANSFLLDKTKIYFPKRLVYVFNNREYAIKYYSFYNLKDLERMILKRINSRLEEKGIFNIRKVELIDLEEGFVPVSLSGGLPSRVGINIEYIRKSYQSVGYNTKIIYSQNLKQGQKRILRQGKNGKIEKVYSVVLDFEGNMDSRLISGKFLEYPEDKVVEVGIAPYSSLKGKYYLMESTGYTGGVGNVGFYTSTGHRVKRGIVAVDTSIIPLGTKLYVEGYGYAIALDTGSSIRGFKIDLYFETLQEALEWGRRKVKVYILN